MSFLTPSRRTCGWTVERQRAFLDHLALCGTVCDAADHVGLSAASAYRLRSLPAHAGFAAAWDHAMLLAAPRLLAHAYERAINGGTRRVWRDGGVVIEERNPSDRLLMWLLNRIGPPAFRNPLFRSEPEPAPTTPLADADIPDEGLATCIFPPEETREGFHPV